MKLALLLFKHFGSNCTRIHLRGCKFQNLLCGYAPRPPTWMLCGNAAQYPLFKPASYATV